MKWTKLALMAVVSFASMYILMYIMVDMWANVLANVNQFYMVSAMTAAMMLIEIALMGSMYSTKIKITTAGVSLAVLVLSIACVRNQTGVSDKQFLKSMIPHHAFALLMCNKASLSDPEIKKLCDSIVAGQQSEIDWMKLKLSTLEN